MSVKIENDGPVTIQLDSDRGGGGVGGDVDADEGVKGGDSSGSI